MGLLSKVTDPLGITKKPKKAIKKAIGFDPEDPFGHEEKLTGKVKEALGYDFEKWHFKDMWRQLRENPARLLSPVPMVDPLGTKIGNVLTGQNLDPLVNQMGGPTSQRYADYIAQGGDPRAAKNAATAHQVAATIASIYAGGALGALAPGAGAVGGAAGGAGAGTTTGAIAGSSLIPAASTFAGGLGGTGGAIAGGIAAGAPALDEELNPLELEDTMPLITRPGTLRVGNVPGFAEGGLAQMWRR